MSAIPSRDRTDDILRFIAEGSAGSTGQEFFRDLTRCLAAALGVKYAFVSEFTDVKTRVCILAFWNGEGFAEPFEYDLIHTPCEIVLRGEIGFFPQAVQAKFPLHKELVELGVESYLAIPMMNRAGEVLGHLGAMDTRPMPDEARDRNIFKIFGARAAAELERIYMDRRVAASEMRLSGILQCALDAIISVDKQHYITLFNPAAEKAFRCSASWALGQPIERFLVKRHWKVIDNLLSTDSDAPDPHQIWVPEGLSALRADGSEFPIEATCSSMEVKGERYFTFILRDVNERKIAETALRELRSKNLDLQEEMRRQHEFLELIGESEPIKNMLDNIRKVAATDSTVLLIGETGSGKELVANALHKASTRKNQPLITVNCAALPSELIESELFGHEKGAFTGAASLRKGRFELANGGTIFLDEVGELPDHAQAKLLRVLQEQTFDRVGGSQPIRVNVRVIAATNRPLAEMMQTGQFRADLFYRLNVFPIHIPSLRERRSDIPLLVNHFLHTFARKLGKTFSGVDSDSMERLKLYSWPGNVRELQNVIERAAILSNGPMLNIPQTTLLVTSSEKDRPPTHGTMDEIARKHIIQTLEECQGRIEGPLGAANLLGMKPSTLRYRMRRLGIDKSDP